MDYKLLLIYNIIEALCTGKISFQHRPLILNLIFKNNIKYFVFCVTIIRIHTDTIIQMLKCLRFILI